VRADSWFRFLFIVYCLEAGLFLAIAPWTTAWERLVLLLPLAPIRQLCALSWARGLVSGFGLIHLVWAAHDVDLLLRPPSPGTDSASRPVANPGPDPG
jgi:hypothetical protein